MKCNVKLNGGNVIDGTGAPARAADVAIAGGSIQAVGDLSDLSKRSMRSIVPGASWSRDSSTTGRGADSVPRVALG
jgi:hypothetical protein